MENDTYFVATASPSDKYTATRINSLLSTQGIRRDANLDYTCAVFGGYGHIVTTGSCFANSLL